jgi:hypothetical protein
MPNNKEISLTVKSAPRKPSEKFKKKKKILKYIKHALLRAAYASADRLTPAY